MWRRFPIRMSVASAVAFSTERASAAHYRTELLKQSASAEISAKPLPQFHRDTVLAGGSDRKNNLVLFNLTPAAILDLKDEIIQYSKSVEDSVASVSKGQHSFGNTFARLADLENAISPLVTTCNFLHHVHPDSSVRDASSEADKALSAYFVESGMREDVYRSVVEAVEEMKQSGEFEKLTVEDKRYVEYVLRDFKRNGLHLDEAKRQRIKEIQTEMSELSIAFSRNLAEDTSSVWLTKEEMTGMPSDFIEKLEKKEVDGVEQFSVTMKYPDVYPFLKLCKVPDSRRKVENCYSTMCKDSNSVILEKLVSLRHEKSQLMGFENHAAFVLDIRMAKSPKVVLEFLHDLLNKLSPLYSEELEIFKRLKKEQESISDEKDSEIRVWDYRYYMNLREEKEFMVDHEVVKQYFPLDKVTKGMMDIYQQFLALKFEEVPDAEVWHPDVKLFRVFDSRDGSLVGEFFLDLHPRKGKYGHAAVFGLQPSFGFSDCEEKSDVNQYPVAAMVANFTKPGADKPSLLNHNEVVTFFHEFGHVVHQICSKTKYSRFSGTRVERDFVEAPSQMLENWCWEKESLLKMSGHYQSGEVLPDEILEKLIAAKNANSGIFNIRQIFFGIFDQTIHSMSQVNTAEVYNSLLKSILKIEPSEGSNGSATFGHLAGGYDATYYGYLWSEVYSADMFATKFKNGKILSQEAGLEYRNKILKVGGSRDAIDSLQDFLGRQPSSEAFLKSKGLSSQ